MMVLATLAWVNACVCMLLLLLNMVIRKTCSLRVILQLCCLHDNVSIIIGYRLVMLMYS